MKKKPIYENFVVTSKVNWRKKVISLFKMHNANGRDTKHDH